jgi:hypothetical protein
MGSAPLIEKSHGRRDAGALYLACGCVNKFAANAEYMDRVRGMTKLFFAGI